jgi:hypothetical protein
MERVNGYNVEKVSIEEDILKNIIVYIKVKHFLSSGEQIRITTKDILPYLEEKNIKVRECVISSVISNLHENSLEGTWIFRPLNKLEEILQINPEEEKIVDEAASKFAKKEKFKKIKKKEPATE